MFRSVAALVLAVFLGLAPVISQSHDPVQAIQKQGHTFCTVFSINEDQGYFATAGHCALNVLQNNVNGLVTILGSPATVEMISFNYDVAVFHADVHVPALKLAKQTVERCDPKKPAECEIISIQGFPYSLPGLITVTGRMAARNIPILHPSYKVVMYSDILDITTAGGNSGSPVMNSNGDVIGILWGGFVDKPLSLSIPLDYVKAALRGYMED